jgi:hypothetical protein
MQKAMARAKDMAENQGRPFVLTPNVGRNALMAADGGGQRGIGSFKQVTGQGLQDLKMSIDAMLADPAAGIAGKEGDIVKGLRAQLINWMEKQNPEFRAARTKYADLSKPVDRMQVGQYLLDKVQPALADFGALGQETGATYARALRNADQTVRGATGFRGNSSLEALMGPDQMGVLNAVGADLARKSNAQNLGRGIGSNTFQNFSLDNIAQQSGAPRLTGGLLELPGVSRATAWMYRETDQKMRDMLAEALLDPKKAAELMTRADRRWLENNPGTRRLLEQAVVRSGGLLGMASTSSLAESGE